MQDAPFPDIPFEGKDVWLLGYDPDNRRIVIAAGPRHHPGYLDRWVLDADQVMVYDRSQPIPLTRLWDYIRSEGTVARCRGSLPAPSRTLPHPLVKNPVDLFL